MKTARSIRIRSAAVLRVGRACGCALAAHVLVSASNAASLSTDLMDLSLEELLNTSITTASKSAERQSGAPGVVSVVTRDDLERFGGTTLKDVLERVPGLAASSTYMTDRSMIAIRGDQVAQTSNHVLVLINGRPVREILEGGISSEIFETFPLGIVERIEVVKGPGSVLYGSNAVAGVINIITQQAERTGFEATALAGESGAVGAATALRVKAGDLSVIGGARYLEKAAWATDYVAAFAGGTVTGALDIPNRGLGSFVNASWKHFSLMAAYHRWETGYVIPDFMGIFTAYGDARWEKIFSDFGYDQQVTDAWRTTAHVTYTQSNFETSTWPYVARNSHETIAEWTNFLQLSSRVDLTAGLLVNEIVGFELERGQGIVASDDERFGAAVYSQLGFAASENVKLIAGVQANKIQGMDVDVGPRAGVIWTPAARFTIKALYGQAYRAPSINETSLDAYLKGNPHVRPEHVATFDLSVGYQGEQSQVALNFFRSEISDIIYQNRLLPVPTYANLADTATVEGVEFETKQYLSRAVFVSGSALYQRSDDGRGNDAITPIASLGAKAGISYEGQGVTLGLFDVYQGGLDDKYDAPLNPAPGAYHKVALHLRLDLQRLLNWDVGRDTALVVQVGNLFDKKIWLPAWGQVPGQSLPYDSGRAVYAGFQSSF